MISVVIPTYKSPEYLDWCLHSCIEGQTLDTNEIIVIVDGHYEMSESVIKKYEVKIKVIDVKIIVNLIYIVVFIINIIKNKQYLIIWIFII